MTREESWDVAGVTKVLLDHVTSMGFLVSVHRLGGSLSGRHGPSIEMHAVRGDELFVVTVAEADVRPGEDDAYRCACELARSVGVDLED